MYSPSKWAAAGDFQQCGILTIVDSDEPVMPLFKVRNSKWCSVSSLTLRIFKWLAKAQIRLCFCTGWSEPLLVAHTTLLEISCRGSNAEDEDLDAAVSLCVLTWSIICTKDISTRKLFNWSRSRPLDKSVYLIIKFLISQPKRMLWVLKRTVSMRRFFWAPKTNVKTDG